MKIDLKDYISGRDDLFTATNVVEMEEALNKFVEWYETAINYTRCCETVKDKYTHTFEVDLNSEKRQQEYNKQIEQIHNAPCKVYFYDGEKYIEL